MEMKYTYILLILPALVCGNMLIKNDNNDLKELCPLIEQIRSLQSPCLKIAYRLYMSCPWVQGRSWLRDQVITHGSQPSRQLDEQLIKLYDKNVCQISQFETFEPKELCPLTKYLDKTFCNQVKIIDNFDPKELCPLIELFDEKECQ